MPAPPQLFNSEDKSLGSEYQSLEAGFLIPEGGVKIREAGQNILAIKANIPGVGEKILERDPFCPGVGENILASGFLSFEAGYLKYPGVPLRWGWVPRKYPLSYAKL